MIPAPVFCLRALFAVFLTLAMLAVPHAFGQNVNDGFNSNVNGPISAIALQPDGKILVGGNFFNAGGIVRSNIVRFLVDGGVDLAFVSSANGTIQCLAVQANASILVGGEFTVLRGQPRNHIGRISIAGNSDVAFDPNANGVVKCVVVQSDKIVVGGEFTTLGGQACSYLGRLQTNGTLDLGFRADANDSVRALAALSDGKLLVAGTFTTLNGQPCDRIGRLMPNGSLDLTFSATANGPVNSIVVQVDGKIILGGEFSMLCGQPRQRLGRLNADGSLDSSFDAPVGGVVRALALQPDGGILVGGAFTNLVGQARTNLSRLNSDGNLDSSFALPANGTVACVVVQPDNKLLFAGEFTSVGGANRSRIARAYRDGSLDATLAGGTTGNTSPSPGVALLPGLAIQPDGKILIGGNFSGVGGQNRKGIARLNAGGTIDTMFVPSTGTNAFGFAVLGGGSIVVLGAFTNRSGLSTRIGRLSADGTTDTSFDAPAVPVFAMATQPDGKTLVGGQFSIIDGHPHANIARLNLDGSLDEAFVPSTDALVYCLAVQPDGRILLGGLFLTVNGQPRNRIARLNEDGSLDFSFNPGAGDNTGTFFPPGVQTLVLQPDGKILAGGRFTTLGGQPRECVGRLNADGSIDSTFINPRANSGVYGLALQTDGKILLGGDFEFLGGLPRSRIARVNPDGSPDTMFNPGANDKVTSMAIQDDGKILVGGWFTNIAGQLRPRLARLTSGSAARQMLAIDAAGSTITWSRSGASPEVGLVRYEISSNGGDYDFLGLPARIAGGWQLTAQTLPVGQSFFIRASGRTTSGEYNSSMGIVESVAQFYLSPPTLTGLTMENNGTFRFAFSNSFATAYTVLASTNVSLPVAQWDVLGAPSPLVGGLYQFTDPNAANHPQRFYQLRSQ